VCGGIQPGHQAVGVVAQVAWYGQSGRAGERGKIAGAGDQVTGIGPPSTLGLVDVTWAGWRASTASTKRRAAELGKLSPWDKVTVPPSVRAAQLRPALSAMI
jgi:hypothetical protein